MIFSIQEAQIKILKMFSSKIYGYEKSNVSVIDFEIALDQTYSRNHQIDELVLAVTVINILSIAGCMFNLITVLVLRSTSNTVTKMVIGLSVIDLIFNGISLFEGLEITSNLVCQAITFITYFAYGGSLTLTCCFAHALHTGIKDGGIHKIDPHLKSYAIVSVFLGVVIGALPVAVQYNIVDNTSEICWHPINPNTFDWRDLIISCIPPFLSVIYSAYCYIAVMKFLRKLGSRMYLELLLYPVILVVCFFPWITLDLYVNFLRPQKPSFLWQLIANILLNAQGLLNALAYGLSRKIILGYREKCCRRIAPTAYQSSAVMPEASDPNTFNTSDMLVSHFEPSGFEKYNPSIGKSLLSEGFYKMSTI